MYYNTNTFKRDLQSMDIPHLKRVQKDIVNQLDMSDGWGESTQELWEVLQTIPNFIRRKIAGEQYKKIKGRQRGQEIDHCGYDDVLHEQLLA
jgi:hypothetical protein